MIVCPVCKEIPGFDTDLGDHEHILYYEIPGRSCEEVYMVLDGKTVWSAQQGVEIVMGSMGMGAAEAKSYVRMIPTYEYRRASAT